VGGRCEGGTKDLAFGFKTNSPALGFKLLFLAMEAALLAGAAAAPVALGAGATPGPGAEVGVGGGGC